MYRICGAEDTGVCHGVTSTPSSILVVVLTSSRSSYTSNDMVP